MTLICITKHQQKEKMEEHKKRGAKKRKIKTLTRKEKKRGET
jgi:hypothetical protein